MKKFVAFMLALSLLVLPLCIAEEAEGIVEEEAEVEEELIDVTALTDDELMTLYTQVNNEYISRYGSSSDFIAAGIFEAGKDIKPGIYEFNCLGLGESRSYGEVITGTKVDSEGESDIERNFDVPLDKGDIVMVTIEDGMILKLSGCYGLLRSAAEQSWAP